MWKSLQSLGRIALRSTPLYRHAGGESQAIKEVRARALPSIQQMGGSVVVNESNNDDNNAPLLAMDSSLPKSIDMLTSNKIPVQPSLLLKALPWDSLSRVSAPIGDQSLADKFLHDLNTTHKDLLRWKELGHLVNPQLAVEICKKLSTFLSLREIEKVIDTSPTGPLSVVKEVLEQNDVKIAKLAQRHTRILELLEKNDVEQAYARAHSALRSLESVHALLESARLRALAAQKTAGQTRWALWTAAGSGVVLGLACEFLACVPEGQLSSLLLVLRDTVAAGTVVCLSLAAYNQLHSPDFSNYLQRFRDAQDARLRLRLRLEEDVHECLERGYRPALAF